MHTVPTLTRGFEGPARRTEVSLLDGTPREQGPGAPLPSFSRSARQSLWTSLAGLNVKGSRAWLLSVVSGRFGYIDEAQPGLTHMKASPHTKEPGGRGGAGRLMLATSQGCSCC